MKLPVSFENKMKVLLKEEYDAYLASYDLPKYQGFRINTLKISLEEWEKINPFKEVKNVPWCKEGFYYGSDEKPGKHPYYYAGLYYIQEPSAMSPGAYMPIEEGDKVLDLCAAPGGKSTQLAAKLGQSGVLVSNDISASRARALLKNLENWGARNIIVTSEDTPRLASKWVNYFDKILIDAPCSGEGMFRKSEDAIKSWETHGVEHCCNLQKCILENVVKMLKPNGMILYSTCTFSPEEDECMIQNFLENNPDFSIVPLKGVGGISNGRPEWVPGGGKEELKGALRLWPHHMEGEGHFVCLLQRHGEGEGSVPQVKCRKCIKDYKEAAEFIEAHTYIDLNTSVEEIKGKLYILPEEAPDLSGIRAIRSGLYLGEIKSKRFEPSQAMVLAYPKEMFKRVIEIGEDEEMVKRYLKGETLLIEATKGWHIVCMQGYPLGWVKAQNNMLKNQYPASWRMMG